MSRSRSLVVVLCGALVCVASASCGDGGSEGAGSTAEPSTEVESSLPPRPVYEPIDQDEGPSSMFGVLERTGAVVTGRMVDLVDRGESGLYPIWVATYAIDEVVAPLDARFLTEDETAEVFPVLRPGETVDAYLPVPDDLRDYYLTEILDGPWLTVVLGSSRGVLDHSPWLSALIFAADDTGVVVVGMATLQLDALGEELVRLSAAAGMDPTSYVAAAQAEAITVRLGGEPGPLAAAAGWPPVQEPPPVLSDEDRLAQWNAADPRYRTLLFGAAPPSVLEALTGTLLKVQIPTELRVAGHYVRVWSDEGAQVLFPLTVGSFATPIYVGDSPLTVELLTEAPDADGRFPLLPTADAPVRSVLVVDPPRPGEGLVIEIGDEVVGGSTPVTALVVSDAELQAIALDEPVQAQPIDE